LIRSSRTSRDRTSSRRRRLALVAAPLAGVAVVALLLLESRDEPVAAPMVEGPGGGADESAAVDPEPELPGRADRAIVPLDGTLARRSAEPLADVRAGAIAGQVVRASDGSPLAGAFVRLLPDGPLTPVGLDARFSLPPRVGAETLEVRFKGAQGSGAGQQSWPHVPQSYRLDSGPADALRLEYDSGFTLDGVVVDDGDHPLPGALVSVLVSGSGLWSTLNVTADEVGNYRVQDLSPPSQLGAISVTAKAEGYAPAQASLPLAGDGSAVRTLDFRLPREGAIEVTALGLADPVPETHTREGDDESPLLRAVVLTEQGQSFAKTGDARFVRISGLPAGRHAVGVGLTNGYGPEELVGPRAPLRLDDVLVEAGRTTRVEVTLPDGATVMGRVTDTHGVPVEHADVWFDMLDAPGAPADASPAARYGRTIGASDLPRRWTATGPAGEFTLNGVPPGRVRIAAKAKGLARAAVELDMAPGETRAAVDLALPAGQELRGRVVLADGSPMQFCTKVIVLPADAASREVLAKAETGPEGLFTADGVEPGPKRVLVVGADGSWLEETVEVGGELQTFVARP
jgi:hypothetical protein